MSNKDEDEESSSDNDNQEYEKLVKKVNKKKKNKKKVLHNRIPFTPAPSKKMTCTIGKSASKQLQN